MKKNENKAIAILSEGFKSMQGDILKSDAATIAKIIDKVPHAVRPYLQGTVSDFNTGSIIMAELKKLIKDREKAAQKLVA